MGYSANCSHVNIHKTCIKYLQVVLKISAMAVQTYVKSDIGEISKFFT